MKILKQYLAELNDSTNDVVQQKKILRKALCTERSLKKRDYAEKDWGIRQFLRALELLKISIISLKEYTVASYFPIRDELNLSLFAEPNWIFPKIGNNNELLWFEYGDGRSDYFKNKYGIYEKKDHLCFQLAEKHFPLLCFLPGLAASKSGFRLGYGGGFYDRFLNQYQKDLTSILCLPSEDFLFDELPIEVHDKKIDLIVW